MAFLSIYQGNVRVIQIEPYFSPVDRALEKIPDIADMLGRLFQKSAKEDGDEPASQPEPAPAQGD